MLILLSVPACPSLQAPTCQTPCGGTRLHRSLTSHRRAWQLCPVQHTKWVTCYQFRFKCMVFKCMVFSLIHLKTYIVQGGTWLRHRGHESRMCLACSYVVCPSACRLTLTSSIPLLHHQSGPWWRRRPFSAWCRCGLLTSRKQHATNQAACY